MCGRTSLFAPRPTIEERFDATFDVDYRPRYNVAPGDDLVVVHDDDPATLTADEWGFVPAWADDVTEGPRPINARAESIAENRLFRSAFEERRALVVADGFYEWKGSRGGKRPYRIAREDGGLFAMAGVWSEWRGAEDSLSTVAIVTTAANPLLEPIHDRMPVILTPETESAWLTADPSTATDLLTPNPADDFEATPVSTLVNDPSNDSPAVVDPVGGERGQTGLDDF